jgi:hypothetical protein
VSSTGSIFARLPRKQESHFSFVYLTKDNGKFTTMDENSHQDAVPMAEEAILEQAYAENDGEAGGSDTGDSSDGNSDENRDDSPEPLVQTQLNKHVRSEGAADAGDPAAKRNRGNAGENGEQQDAPGYQQQQQDVLQPQQQQPQPGMAPVPGIRPMAKSGARADAQAPPRAPSRDRARRREVSYAFVIEMVSSLDANERAQAGPVPERRPGQGTLGSDWR